MDDYNTFPVRQNYGTYDSQIPMKTFAGQPALATMNQVNQLENRMDRLEDRIRKDIPNVHCNQCPASKDECKNITDPLKRQHCMVSYDQCKKNDCYSS